MTIQGPRVGPFPPPVPGCPPGWETGPPDFVGVGAHRSGTTWLYQMIVAHPRVSVPDRQKEIHFFEGFWEGGFTAADVARYHAYFPRAPGTIVGEWTPRYMFDSWTPRMLAKVAPAARLLVLLRDPVARYVSHLGTHLSRGGPQRAQSGPAVSSIALARSLYTAQVLGLLRHFPRERVLVQQFERCMLEPEQELRRTYAFLGLDAGFVPGNLSVSVNAGGAIDLEPQMVEDVAAAVTPDAIELARRFEEIDLSLWPGLLRS